MADELSYGGLDDASFQPPKEVVKDFSANRWRPTRRGNYPSWTIRPVVGSAYMFSHAPGIAGNDEQTKKTRLWVNEISIGWSMQYSQAQTLFGKSFYPRHIKYSNAIVRCQSADQNHYDEMVTNVISYQKSALSGEASIVRFVLPKYVLYRPGAKSATWVPGSEGVKSNNDARVVYQALVFDGYPLSIAAGHRKGVYNPDLELTFAVIAYQNEVRSDIVSKTDQDPTDIVYKRYRDSLETKSWGVEAASDISESGYGSFYGGAAGGPGGNQG